MLHHQYTCTEKVILRLVQPLTGLRLLVTQYAWALLRMPPRILRFNRFAVSLQLLIFLMVLFFVDFNVMCGYIQQKEMEKNATSFVVFLRVFCSIYSFTLQLIFV